MKAIYYRLFMLLLVVMPFQLFAQAETQAMVADRINLGVKYLSEKEHIKSIEELIGAKETAIRNDWYPKPLMPP